MKIIVIGAGKVGYLLAQMLSMENHDVTVVDYQASRLEVVEERLDVKTVLGSCSSAVVLKEAGIDNTDILAAVTERDELNIVACFMAKSSGVRVTIARVRNPEFVDLDRDTMKQALGIDLIINPERIAAKQIAKMINYPKALNVEYYDNGRVQLLEFRVQVGAAVINRRLKDVVTDQTFLVVGIIRGGKMIIPFGNDYIYEDDLVFLITATDSLAAAEKCFGQVRSRKVKNVIIAGGGTISYYLASMLEEQGFNIKIIEDDYDKCKELANKLNHSLIIRGDASDLQLLKDENVEDADLFLALTEDDRLNFLSAVLAKNMGADRTITQMRMSDYIPIAESVGIDQNISPRLLAASAILKYVRTSNILSVTLIDDAKAQVLELLVPEDAKHINIPLADLDFPQNAILGTISRGGSVIIPKGHDVVLPGDHLILFALPGAVRAVEHYFKEKVI